MSDPKKEYEVGYRKPPKSTRFKKGQSGNTRGRPRGAKGFNASLQKELERKVPVREGGREVRLSKAQIAAKRLAEKAMKGDMSALKMLGLFDTELSHRAEREARYVARSSEPDETDEAVLGHFFELAARGQFEPDELVEPVLSEDEGDTE
ncbi:DUF5681 domain-containing protein [Halocynthiibacter sp. C4]|uniref:DUF5681 domain-containing protein n=1 Tax=Halocynthiibacter sp. C4 TaxID=2992758 RepID=UPI00237C34C1|nr:DUF5681 domain-containing protein [Halocynthiibacter sp. C4]MDE0589078.1 DUF5681 domain-containing protein [Halocynthiibacter sp. C4]